jgi:hypothetical protein
MLSSGLSSFRKPLARLVQLPLVRVPLTMRRPVIVLIPMLPESLLHTTKLPKREIKNSLVIYRP